MLQRHCAILLDCNAIAGMGWWWLMVDAVHSQKSECETLWEVNTAKEGPVYKKTSGHWNCSQGQSAQVPVQTVLSKSSVFFFFFRMHIQASCSYFQLISINFWDTIETSRNCKRTWGACPMLLCFNMTMTSALLPDLPDGSSAFQSLRRPGKPGFSWTASPVIRWRRQVSENNWRTEPSPWPSAQNGELLGDLLED